MSTLPAGASVSSAVSDDRGRRYALCGLSNRGLWMYALPLLGRAGPVKAATDLSAYGQLVAVVDVDAERVSRFNDMLDEPVPFYHPDEFDRMVGESEPDVVVVATPDYSHSRYITAALDSNVDVVTEKPLGSTCEQIRAILRAEETSGASLRVAHNFRYTPRHRQLKQMMLDGLVGRVTNIELNWSVDTFHGSSYFYRWHRRRAYSGGLSITKSCHHFDMINWLIDDVPEQVFAYGGLNYYGPRSPHNPSLRDGVAYSVAEQKERCPYAQRWRSHSDLGEGDGLLTQTTFDGLSYDAQYPPDRPLYIYDDEIDIEDTYSAVVRYQKGATMAYSITFSGPWEGYRLVINGTHGRIEASNATFRDRDEALPGAATITYYPMFGDPQVIPVRSVEGGHDGADPMIQRDLFVEPSEESRRLGLPASSRDGAYAVALGEAIWRSVQENRPYEISELLG